MVLELKMIAVCAAVRIIDPDYRIKADDLGFIGGDFGGLLLARSSNLDSPLNYRRRLFERLVAVFLLGCCSE